VRFCDVVVLVSIIRVWCLLCVCVCVCAQSRSLSFAPCVCVCVPINGSSRQLNNNAPTRACTINSIKPPSDCPFFVVVVAVAVVVVRGGRLSVCVDCPFIGSGRVGRVNGESTRERKPSI
jgi:hypothetical protein